MKTGGNEHRCKQCGPVFQTGQFLDRHQRAHYDLGENKNPDGSSLEIEKKDPIKDLDELCSVNTIEEIGQLPITNEGKLKVTNESSSTKYSGRNW